MVNSVLVASHQFLSTEDVGALRRAVDDVAEGRPVAEVPRLTVGVSGGAPPERFFYSVSLDAAGQGEYRLIDEMNDRAPVNELFEVPREDVTRIFELLRRTEVVDRAHARQLTPDSLVGFVSLRQGEAENRILFPVWDAAPGGWKNPRMVPLPTQEEALHVDPETVPRELIEVFGTLSAVARQSRLVTES